MENKDLVWRDYYIELPKEDFVYFDNETNENHLDKLSELFHAGVRVIKDDNDDPHYAVVYYAKGQRLVSINCEIILTYINVEKVKVKAIDHDTHKEVCYGNN